MINKILGYLLLFCGIATILYSGLSVYQVFTGRARAYKIFNFQSVSLSLDPAQLAGQSIELPQELLDAGITVKDTGSKKPIEQEILPSDILNDTSNIFAHLLLMGFVASVGFKFASLGTQLVRPIVVNAKGEILRNEKKMTNTEDKKGKTEKKKSILEPTTGKPAT